MNKHDPLTPEEESLRFVSRFYRADKNNTSEAWKKILPHLRQKRKPSRRIWLYRASTAAALFAGIVIGIICYWNRSHTDWITVTANTEAQELFLPDQSNITLSPGSSLRYNRLSFGKDERRVELSGKAYFAVHHEADRPFRVTTPTVTIQVLGTQFQVKADTDSTTAFVASGKVRFSTGKAYCDLTADMRAVNLQDGKIRVTEAANRNELAWKTHRLTYRHTSLRQVVEDLEQVYGVSIAGVPEEELFLTSDFNEMQLTDIIHIINQTLDTHLSVEP